MKKLLTLAALVAAISAQAASIDWKIGGASNKFYDASGNPLSKVNAYLLLQDGYDTWNNGLTSASTAADIAAALTSASIDGAKEYTDLNTSGTFTSSSATKLAPSTAYDFYLIVLDPNTGKYLDLGSKNDLTYTDGKPTTLSWTAAQSVFTTTPGKTQYNANAWTTAAVPEPATGALALAGVALLFRRRRA